MSDFMQQPQHGTQQPYPGSGPYGGAPQHQPQPARNGLGTAALVLGIIGALSGLITLLFWLAGVLGLIALILGLAGRGRVKRGEAVNKGVTTTGAVLGLVALILSVVGAVIMFEVDDAAKKSDKELSATAPQDPAADKSSGAPAAEAPEATEDAVEGKPLAAGDTSIYDDDVQVTVSAPTSVKPGESAIGHTKGNKAYELTIVVENAGKEKFSTDTLTVSARAGEDGVTAEEIFDGDTYGKGFSGAILPGKKATVKYAFDVPADAKTLTVEVLPGFDYNANQWDLKL
jgi:hypothetical protein